MKYALAVLSVLSGALAQDVDTQLPKCATDCVTKFTAGTEIAGCKQGNIECVCKNADFLDNIACCLAGVCGEDDQKSAVTFARRICGSAGVDVPDAVVCKNSTGSASSSSTGSNGGASSSTSGPASSSSNSPASGNNQGGGDSGASIASLSIAGLIAAFFAGVAML